MIKEHLGHRIDGWVHALFPFLFWRPLHPDALTLLGTLVAGSAGLAFAEGEPLGAGLLLLAGGFFDLVDGVVARHFGRVTRFGAFLDSSMDRVVDILVMAGLIVAFVRADDGVLATLSIVILVASVLTSYAKARAELVLERMPGGLLERGERIGLLAIGAITGLLGPVLWLLAVGTVVTVGQRFLYARREMARLDIADREAVRHPGA
ncbi:MAG: CDP-alcohol phosphatidyltransferase family protein [Myxococcales bacterium]|nr:CDP-alcohol phosphatidyltransferase family protein [Myxococcales bacterium]